MNMEQEQIFAMERRKKLLFIFFPNFGKENFNNNFGKLLTPSSIVWVWQGNEFQVNIKLRSVSDEKIFSILHIPPDLSLSSIHLLFSTQRHSEWHNAKQKERIPNIFKRRSGLKCHPKLEVGIFILSRERKLTRLTSLCGSGNVVTIFSSSLSLVPRKLRIFSVTSAQKVSRHSSTMKLDTEASYRAPILTFALV